METLIIPPLPNMERRYERVTLAKFLARVDAL
jgi:hypothetical protein